MSLKLDLNKIDWSLYAILDKEFVRDRSITFLAEELVQGGASVIQLRDKISESREFYKDAVKVIDVTRKHGIPFIINDRLDVALAVQAEGVHLGQKDLPLDVARNLIGNQMILGASVHNLDEFHQAVEAGADYLGVGTIYPTSTKQEEEITGVEIVETLRPKTDLPLVAIGGITVANLAPVIQAGADGVAVISALLNAEDVAARTHEFVQKIKSVRYSNNKIFN